MTAFIKLNARQPIKNIIMLIGSHDRFPPRPTACGWSLCRMCRQDVENWQLISASRQSS
jgi:hypothetical protein